jgi:exodeoxyribonuclease V alpha subunit
VRRRKRPQDERRGGLPSKCSTRTPQAGRSFEAVGFGSCSQLTRHAGPDRWRLYLPDLPADPVQLASLARWAYDPPALGSAFDAVARAEGERTHPERAAAHTTAVAARAALDQALRARSEASDRRLEQKRRFGLAGLVSDAARAMADLDRDLDATRERLTDLRRCITALTSEPVLLAEPPERLAAERDDWRVQREAAARPQRQLTAAPDPDSLDVTLPGPGYQHALRTPGPSHGGPSIGI